MFSSIKAGQFMEWKKLLTFPLAVFVFLVTRISIVVLVA